MTEDTGVVVAYVWTNIHLYRYVYLVIFRLKIHLKTFFFLSLFNICDAKISSVVWEDFLLKMNDETAFSKLCFLLGNVNMSLVP